MTALFALALALLLVAGSGVTVTQGITHATPSGFMVSNFDPDLNSTLNNQYYDANFIPGFQVGLTNTSVSWQSGPGFGRVGYDVGTWASDEQGIPHLAVGPQCCNFVEVPHTQQFRQPSWGDYTYVRAGFGGPGVNVQNYTADFKTAADVGLRTDWNWTVQVSFDWTNPVLLDSSNEWVELGIATTQYVPNFPGNLVYTVVNFWMDGNSSHTLNSDYSGVPRTVDGSNVVVYHPVQLSAQGNQTVTLNLSPYLADTLETLGVKPSQPPVISYVYLNVEGYNFDWNTSLWSFRVMSPAQSASYSAYYIIGAGAAVASAVVVASVYLARRKSRTL
jgi:hypothetical protein